MKTPTPRTPREIIKDIYYDWAGDIVDKGDFDEDIAKCLASLREWVLAKKIDGWIIRENHPDLKDVPMDRNAEDAVFGYNQALQDIADFLTIQQITEGEGEIC